MNSILYCGNDKVYSGMLLSVMSIIKNYKGPLAVYIMTMDLRQINRDYAPVTKKQADFFEKILRETNEESRVYLIDVTAVFLKEMDESKNLNTGYTPYTLLRLYAEEIKDIPDRILYLDTDTLANDDISPLFDIDISDYEFAGVRDYLGKWFIGAYYINAGVLYLNMEKIRQTHLFKRARRLCMTKKMAFPDQDALNKLVEDKLMIPRKYNEQRKYRNNTVIQHFCKSIRLFPYFHTVNIKPWEIDRMHKVYKLFKYDEVFWDYEKKTEEFQCYSIE